MREYRKITDRRLLIGFFLLIFVVGDGLIFLFLGKQAAIFGLGCLTAAMIPALLVVLVLWVMQRISENMRDW